MQNNYLLLFLCFCGLGLSAQQSILINNVQSNSLYYDYNNAGGSSANQLKEMFKAVAPSNYQSVNFELQYTEDQKLMKSGNTLEAKVLFKQIATLQAPNYKNFGSSKYFMPSSVTFTVEVRNSAGNVMGTKQFSNLSISGLSSQLASYRFQDTLNTAHFEMEVKGLVFNYNNGKKEAIQSFVSDVDAYYQGEQDLQKIATGLAKINWQNLDVDSMTIYENILKEEKKRLSKIQKANYWSSLEFKQKTANDFLGLGTQLTTQETAYTNADKAYEEQLANIHKLYLKKAKAFYASKKRKEAEDYLGKSLKVKANYMEAKLFKATITKDDKKHKELYTQLKDLGTIKTMKEENQVLYSNFIEEVKIFWMQESTILSAQKKHSQAVELVDYADELCAFKWYKGTTVDLKAVRLNVVKSWYEHLYQDVENNISTIQQETNTKQFSNADKLFRIVNDTLDKLKSIEKDYKGVYQPSKQLAPLEERVYVQKYDTKMRHSEELLNKDYLSSALVKAREALKLTASKPYLSNRKAETKALIENIQYQRYSYYTKAGDEHQGKGAYAQAMSNYRRAQKVEQEMDFEANGKGLGVNDKIKVTARLYILIEGQKKVASTSNKELKAAIKEYKALMAEFSFEQDVDLQAVIQQIEDKICQNARELLFAPKVEEVKNRRDEKRYIQANEAMNAAIAIAKEYANCGIDLTYINVVKEEVQKCSAYQKYMENAILAENAKKYKKAIKNLEEAQKLYTLEVVNKQLDKSNKTDVFNYLMSVSSADYKLAGGYYYNKKGDKKSAFDLMKNAINSDVSIRKTKDLQKDLGAWGAEQVFAKGKKMKKAFEELVGSNKYDFRHMKSSFNKKWRALK